VQLRIMYPRSAGQLVWCQAGARLTIMNSVDTTVEGNSRDHGAARHIYLRASTSVTEREKNV